MVEAGTVVGAGTSSLRTLILTHPVVRPAHRVVATRGARGGAVTRPVDVVVGAGSSGCVVAARLSEEGTRRVALIVAGNDGWTFSEVLETFVALKTDHDRTDPWHGRTGPVGISRYSRPELSSVQSASVDAAVAVGHTFEEDLNRPGASGVGPVPTNAIDDVRQSAALTHLEILANAVTYRVLLRDGRAAGVLLVHGRLIEADEVILCAGAYGSAAILLRSGVGPAEHLRDVGVDVVADLPGVGENLVDHPVLWLFASTADAAAPATPTFLTALVSASSGSLVPDLHVLPRYSPADGPLFILGTVRLVSADPSVARGIAPRSLSRDADMARMVEASELGKEVLQTPPLAHLTANFAPADAVAELPKRT